jgi:hypothetical protein
MCAIFRICIRHVLMRRRVNQVEKAEFPSNVENLRNARRLAS